MRSPGLLVLGYSNIVRRRVLPAALSVPALGFVDVASRRGAPHGGAPTALGGAFYDDYARALDASRAEIVYVSTVNAHHAEWARAALLAGRHVIVDKPACVDIESAEALAEIASARGLCLAEALVFEHHPQVSSLRGLFAERGTAPTRATAVFSMPPFEAGNFRLRRELGGGALLDLGPYAAAFGRVIFGERPRSLRCEVQSYDEDRRVEAAFSVMASYSGGRSWVGHFGFDAEYGNWIDVYGRGFGARVQRFFTTAPDAPAEIAFTARGTKAWVSPHIRAIIAHL